MKKLNLLRLLFGAMFLIAATAFTSCVDDNDDDGMPYLEVAPEALTFSAEGVAEGASAVTVKSNRPWTLAFESGADWVTPSATDGKAGTTEVEFSIPASNESRTATLSFQLKNSYGAYFTKKSFPKNLFIKKLSERREIKLRLLHTMAGIRPVKALRP